MSQQASAGVKYWVPEKISSCMEATCQWLYVGDKNFTEPFFGDTIAACKRSVTKRSRFRSVSSLQMMADWAGDADAVAPAAIIFHVSRCGSTLLSQLLSIDQKHIVLSEVPFFDELLRLPYQADIPATEADGYLQSAIRLYAQKRHGPEEQLFIKTDSWHIHFYERLRSLFPATPFVLLYRDPREVIRSQQKQRGLQSVPGLIQPEIFGFAKLRVETNLDHYMASVLASYFSKMIQLTLHDPLAVAFNYSAGVNTILQEIYGLCHLTLDENIRRKSEDRCRYHAKVPQQLFSEISAREKIPDFLEPAYALYRELELLQRKKINLTQCLC